MLTLEAKAAVVWDVCPELEAAQATLAKCYQDVKAKAVVTSARDSVHSKHSAHALGRALDLRITTLYKEISLYQVRAWYERILAFAHDVALALEHAALSGEYYVVLERDHIHVEWAPKGGQPNIQGWTEGRHVYTTAEVQGYLSPKEKP